MYQQGAVDIIQTNDDGDIDVQNGYFKMSGGILSAVYISLFGGNIDDAGGSDTGAEWWGNKSENVAARKYRSRTQYALRNTKQSTGNLSRIVDAAKLDLAWFITERVASAVSVSASIPTLNKIKFVVTITANGVETTFTFTENWKAEL